MTRWQRLSERSRRFRIERRSYLKLKDEDLITWRSFPARLERLRLSRMASGISYFMVFAIFPFLILLLSIVLLFGDRLLLVLEKFIDLSDFFPSPVLNLFEGLYQEATGVESISAISVSVISLIWAASKGINALIIGMRQIYHLRPPRTMFLLSRLFSVIMTILAGVFVLAVMFVLAFTEAALSILTDWTGIVIANRSLIRLISFATGFTILDLTFFLIYYFSAAVKTRVRHALAASSLAALAWVISSAGFSFYVSRSTTLTVYGGMTGVVILMLWLYVCTYALLLGAAFHAALRDRSVAKLEGRLQSKKRSGQKSDSKKRDE